MDDCLFVMDSMDGQAQTVSDDLFGISRNLFK